MTIVAAPNEPRDSLNITPIAASYKSGAEVRRQPTGGPVSHSALNRAIMAPGPGQVKPQAHDGWAPAFRAVAAD